ncbi:hypothetical protein RPPS3_26270 [Rhodopseudomonas palustris]|uniref:hypothetical protein n=1 Tax=Rhodopseudomonas palustris TaxID=1076 RepID=UPI000D223888|nr:hypothetical protein [Rhodopseudomonas palustris]AVT76690.1 hypothetical protein RPPS3_26270 [Rhodopseudomonas palustris]
MEILLKSVTQCWRTFTFVFCTATIAATLWYAVPIYKVIAPLSERQKLLCAEKLLLNNGVTPDECSTIP